MSAHQSKSGPVHALLCVILFGNVLAITVVFHTRQWTAYLTRILERIVSVPLSIVLLILLAFHEALLELKHGHREAIKAQIRLQEADELFWGAKSGEGLVVGDDFQSLRLRKGITEAFADATTSITEFPLTKKTTPSLDPSSDTQREQTDATALRKPRVSLNSKNIKACWSLVRDSREYRNVLSTYTSTVSHRDDVEPTTTIISYSPETKVEPIELLSLTKEQ
ncbi:CYFA0S11e00375g1_1 [Cyberlindnera fabianii]|uniref:CYFA0S11e00375g1_1 n=1 Tax=Cyberlindnera fabianii TaxID=36022 RepID=A0A061B0V3_CYBFA|nr:CYFA0S11e00375g1_1 [Cyberlindnera fabianii]